MVLLYRKEKSLQVLHPLALHTNVYPTHYKQLIFLHYGRLFFLSRSYIFHALVFLSAFALADNLACANESSPSVNYMGMVGFNTVPSARMDKEGTARIGVSTLDPYNHAFIGMQIAKPLYINLRQSMEVSSVGGTPEFVYPGMDVKLRLMEEGRYRPEMSFGMNSALGHKRFSSEYFALSKRVNDFDFTAGVAWGRLGSGGHIKNPFSILSHFDKDRDFSSEDAVSSSDWFTGEEIGFFGGVEYFTPLKGLSLKADFGADSYAAEKTSIPGFGKPSNWSVGFNYAPTDWFGFSTSLVGGDKVMARITFQDNLYKSNRKSWKDNPPKTQSDGWLDKLWARVQRGGDDEGFMNISKPRQEGRNFESVLHLNDYQPSSMQIGRAAKRLLGDAPKDVQSITIIPVQNGLEGKSMTFSRRDLEQSMRGTGSPEEIWQDISFTDSDRSVSKKKKVRKFKFLPELQLSMEEETTHLYRASAVIEEQKQWSHGFTSGSAVRFNLADNFHRLYKFRDINLNSVRSDADFFTYNRVNLERGYLSWAKTIIPEFHFAATAGYLEEMYAGFGGEVLYRPFDSPFALGVDAWSVYKRDPFTPLAMGIYGERTTTGFVTGYYDIPDTDITTYAKIGRFLGSDFGVSTGMETQFDSGVKVKGYITATNADDKDIFNSDRNIIGGLSVSIPLGDMRFIPEGSAATARLEPIGRDDGQMLDRPVSLYETTEPTTYRHLGRNWQAVQN